jgi:hypothetical protein
MGRYNFLSQGGEAVDALTLMLAKQEAQKRQTMIDDLNKKNIESQMADRVSNRAIQDETAKSLAAQRDAAAHETLQKNFLKTAPLPGSQMSPEQAKNASAAGYGDSVQTSGGATLPSTSMAGGIPATPGGDTPAPGAIVAPKPVEVASKKDASVPIQQVFKGTPDQQLNMQLSRMLEGVEDPKQIRKIITHSGLIPFDKIDDAVKGVVGEVQNVYRQNPRDGTVEKVGDVPKGSHFMTEPAPKDHTGSDNAAATRLAHSYEYNNNSLEKSAAPLEQQAARLERVAVSIAQKDPQADSLIAPELLTAMAGGQGSGLRMNEAEIARIIGGRSKWETIKAALNQWKPGDKALSITDAQRADISKLVGEINNRLQRRLKTIDEGRTDLIDATDVNEHRKVVQRVKKALSEDMGDTSPATPQQTTSGLPPGVKVTRH